MDKEKARDRLLNIDLVPIVTHPERNPILQKDTKKLEKWVEQGSLVQVTALSVMGGFGKRAYAVAHQLLSEGMVHVIASDAHDPVHRHPRLDEAFQRVAKDYGEDTAELLFNSNPGKIVRGQFVAGGKMAAAAPAKWWKFWGRS